MSIVRLLSATAAFGASEAAAKATRLLVVLAVARGMPAAEIGLAAAAMAGGDLAKSLAETGAAQRVVMAAPRDLDATCAGARRFMWRWCGGLAALHALAAAALWQRGAEELALLVLVLGGEYLFMPGGIAQAGLAMREGRLKGVAAIQGAQGVAANLAAAALALVWPVALALVLPRLLSAPVWLVGMRRLRPWQATAAPAPMRPFAAFGAGVVGVELLRALRMQADKLVVGGILGAEALGLYFLAWSAGLGITSALTAALSVAVFPHLARGGAMRDGLKVALVVVGVAAAIQSFAAPLYVPVLFGAERAHLASAVATLCLAAVPLAIWQVAATRLRAQGRLAAELGGNAALGAAMVAVTAAAAAAGHPLQTIAAAQLGAAALLAPLLARLVHRTAHQEAPCASPS